MLRRVQQVDKCSHAMYGGGGRGGRGGREFENSLCLETKFKKNYHSHAGEAEADCKALHN
jgi:hypothetical protein